MDYEWYICEKYPDFSITKQGLMKNNKTGNILKKLSQNSQIHLCYTFVQDGITYNKAIRYLVAEQFIPNSEGKKYVIYLDGNPLNCSVENLAWSDTKTYLQQAAPTSTEDTIWYPWEESSKYDINKAGQMRNHETFKILKPIKARDGYLYYCPVINGKVKRVAAHICVAKQFIPNPEHKKVVNHKDENRTNCHIDNLEWVTHKENSNHATSSERIRERKEKAINEYNLKGQYIRTWKSAKAFYDFYNLDIDEPNRGSRLLTAARINTNADTQMSIAFGRIFTFYQNSTEDITVNCTQRSLARAKSPFCIQNVPNEYLYDIKDYVTVQKNILSELLTDTFLSPEQKEAITYAIQCIEKCK